MKIVILCIALLVCGAISVEGTYVLSFTGRNVCTCMCVHVYVCGLHLVLWWKVILIATCLLCICVCVWCTLVLVRGQVGSASRLI